MTNFNNESIGITVSRLHSQTDPTTVICNEYSNCIVINRAYRYGSDVQTFNTTISSKIRMPKTTGLTKHIYSVSLKHFLINISLIFIYAENSCTLF